ncbi:Telomerase-binding protein EST1A [Aphelenchoides bicaudatus]|nr:Telomerase-binding protein EST1A [Aphelenchoides bicaudatus]
MIRNILKKEALGLLDNFCKSGEIRYFLSASKLCMKVQRLTYYSILDSMTHLNKKELDSKESLVVQFAQALKRAYLNDQVKNKKAEKSPNEACDDKSRPGRHRRRKKENEPTANGIAASKIILLKRSVDPLPGASTDTQPDQDVKVERTPEPEESENHFYKAYKSFLVIVRKHHSAFFAKLCELLKGFDQNLLLTRDFSANYTKLITFGGCKQVPDEYTNSFDFVRQFLYQEFKNMQAVERIASRTFKLDINAVISPADVYLAGNKMEMSCVYLAKAAIVDPTKAQPFEEMISSENCHVSNYSYALCAFLRDQSNSREISVELQNLSKLYVKFFGTFTLIYDAIFNKNSRHGTPYRRMKNQRWLFPDGVKDPLYDPDLSKRICNNLPKFVDEEWLQMFKYYHYWAGLRLLMFIGYKIINRIDLDQFDEQVQVAIYGLLVGFSSRIADNVHLTQVAKFLITVTTICELRKDSDPGDRAYRTACRLLVEYFAVLLQTFNKLFSTSSLFETLKLGSFTDEMMAYLMPITLLMHWIANSPLFLCYEAWNRRWSFGMSFTADFWPELAQLANSLRLLKNNGFYNGLFVLSETDEREGLIIPEIANSHGTSSVFNSFPKRFLIENEKLKTINPEILIRLFSIWENIQSVANREEFFVYQEKKGFSGQSDEKRFLVPEPTYFDTPKLLPVPLNEIEDCINNQKKELEEEQGHELAKLIELAKSEALNQKSILHDKILVVVRPKYLVMDTNSVIDGLDLILSLLEDPFFTVLIPLPVISELKGLQNKKTKAASPTTQDEEHAKEVSQAAIRSLQVFDSIKKDNFKLLLRNGQVVKMNIDYQGIKSETKINNDRLIIETTKEYSQLVCQKSVRLPRGDIWLYRDVCLITRDRVMMLLANAYRLPSLDIHSFCKWAGFTTNSAP